MDSLHVAPSPVHRLTIVPSTEVHSELGLSGDERAIDWCDGVQRHERCQCQPLASMDMYDIPTSTIYYVPYTVYYMPEASDFKETWVVS